MTIGEYRKQTANLPDEAEMILPFMDALAYQSVTTAAPTYVLPGDLDLSFYALEDPRGAGRPPKLAILLQHA